MQRFTLEFPDNVEVGVDDILLALHSHAPEWDEKVTVDECDIAPDEFVEAARKRHCFGSSDQVEIDEPANMSEGDDGVWIAGWLFVPGVGSQYEPIDVYEYVMPGFDGSTDETDDHVIWVAASKQQLVALLGPNLASKFALTTVDPGEAGVDFHLDSDGEALKARLAAP
jgi:hypothetical protein